EPIARASIDEIAHVLLEAADLRARYTQRREAHGLALAHGNAAGKLRQIFAEGSTGKQPLHLGEPLLRFEPPDPGQHLAQGLSVGRPPGAPVRGRSCAADPASTFDELAPPRFGKMQHPLARVHGFGATRNVEAAARVRLANCARTRHRSLSSAGARRAPPWPLCCPAP